MRLRSATPKPIRRRSNGIRTRAAIVAAAERHFAERGFEATRLDDIAAEVGIRRAAIFYHFGDKQELYAAVLDEVFRDWAEALPTAGSAWQRLEAALISWIDYAARRPTVARMILREAADSRAGKVSPFVSAGRVTIEWARAVIDEGVASGEFAPRIEPRRLMSLVGAMTVFHFTAMPWLGLDAPADTSSRATLDEHKREIRLVVRALLGLPAERGIREARKGGVR
jgi:TetR/AcrR family transcriptional regulator